MYPETEQRRRGVGGAIFAVVAITTMAYLTFAALQGEYGLFRLFQIEAQKKRLELEMSSLHAQLLAISNKAERLSTGTLDLDLLDEQARKIRGLGRPDEIIFR